MKTFEFVFVCYYAHMSEYHDTLMSYLPYVEYLVAKR